jgi:long-chain-fatty-acid--CoA ligase ACSBG
MDKFFSTNPSEAVDLLRADDENDPVTIQKLFNEVVDRCGDRIALMQKDKISKVWKGMNYKVYREKVVNMAKVFIKLGLERHGTVAILGDNCIEWFIADFAAVFAG